MVVDVLGKQIDPELVRIIDKEGDFEEWIDEETGYKCRINRLKSYSHWNGYVRLPDNSTLGQGTSRLPYDNIDVNIHGGLTYMDKFPIPKLDDDGIWVGFDCGHAWDVVPDLAMGFYDNSCSIYRTKEYVKNECKELAKQLKDMEGC